jgi:lipopolysaccharide export system protein LptA
VILRVVSIALLFCLPFAVSAQGTNITLGGINAQPDAPVEISADNLNIDQDSGRAVFSGNVVIGQGDLRLAAGTVQVTYSDEQGKISALNASGGVTFVTESEQAEAASAVYDLDGEQLTLSGNVLLTQGASALTADKMTINLSTGNARMEGRVRTVFEQGDN